MSDNKKPNPKHFVALRQIKGVSRNLLEIEAKYQMAEHEIKDLIYISIYKDFKRDDKNTITMQLDLFKLRTFAEALRELIAGKRSTGYRENSGGQNSTKTLYVAFSEKEVKEKKVGQYWVNMMVGDNKFGTPFDKYQIRALQKTIDALCDTIENAVDGARLKRSISLEATLEKIPDECSTSDIVE